MTDGHLRLALISTDARFRDRLREALVEGGYGFRVALELALRFGEFGEEQVRALRQTPPDLLVVDLDDDPELGIQLLQFLAESNPRQRVIAVGPSLSPGLLLSGMRAGVSDYLQKPVAPDALAESLRRAAALLGRAAESARKAGHVYAVFGAKGGSGSTTLATNLAIALHRLTGKRTLLVDLDLELGEVGVLLGLRPRFHLLDMVQNFQRLDAGLLASYIAQHDSGVHLLAAPSHPEPADAASGDDVRRVLLFLRQHYEYIVVDTAKSFSPATLAAFDQAELVFLVVTLDLPSLRNVQRGLPLLKRVLPRGLDQVRLVVNRYRQDDDVSLRDIEQTLGLRVFRTVSNDYEAVSRSINTGKPLVLNGSSRYARDLRALGAELAGLRGKAGAGRTGLVRRLMGRVFHGHGERRES